MARPCLMRLVLLSACVAAPVWAYAAEPPSPKAPAPDDVSVSVAPAGGDDAPLVGLDLATALDRAQKQSPLIAAAKAGTESFEAKVEQAESFQYPHFKIDTLVGPMPAHRGNPVAGTTDLTDWGIFLSGEVSGYLPLYGFGKIQALKKAARLGVEVGRALEDIARAEVRYRVLKGWFGLSLARELQAVMEEGRGYFDKAKRHVQRTKEEDDPSFDPVDEMKIRVYDAQVRQREMEAVRLREVALGGLRQACGEDPQRGPDMAAPPPAVLVPMRDVTMAEAIEAAMGGRAELLALRKGVMARRAEVNARYWAMYPDFLLVGRITGSWSSKSDYQESPFAYNPYFGWSAGGGLALRWDIDLARKLGEWHESQAVRRKIDADLVDAERGVRLEVEKLFREMTDAREMVGAQQDALKAARGWVVSKLDLYENDLATLRDVLDGLLPFFQSRLDLLKAIHDYDVAVAALERATGLPLVPVPAARPAAE